MTPHGLGMRCWTDWGPAVFGYSPPAIILFCSHISLFYCLRIISPSSESNFPLILPFSIIPGLIPPWSPFRKQHPPETLTTQLSKRLCCQRATEEKQHP
ncbi:hypothetical protein XELAEV_18016371mg [Xenopus laevis]|uniref:Uncharacterized protein n=1 Tax=Xenopus laevis TaxID=8355 RepID=A0A974HX17_XENLA|nr:hypothetical protein XELAEV_18016371mg [Xenopus laevis]